MFARRIRIVSFICLYEYICIFQARCINSKVADFCVGEKWNVSLFQYRSYLCFFIDNFFKTLASKHKIVNLNIEDQIFSGTEIFFLKQN